MAIRPSVALVLATVLAAVTAGGCAGPNGTSTAPSTALAGSPQPASRAASSPVAQASSDRGSSPSVAGEPCDVGDADLPVGAICQASFASADVPVPPYARYTIPAAGWRPFNGGYKDVDGPDGTQRVSAVFVMITNLTVDACRQQVPSEPAIGPSVDDLATALTALSPFEVTGVPTDVRAFGHSGKHLAIRVPLDQPSAGFESFTGCGAGLLKTWISPGHVSSAFNGYTAPGDTEEYWILDLAGQRLVISALTSANASPELVSERQAILDSVQILP